MQVQAPAAATVTVCQAALAAAGMCEAAAELPVTGAAAWDPAAQAADWVSFPASAGGGVGEAAQPWSEAGGALQPADAQGLGAFGAELGVDFAQVAAAAGWYWGEEYGGEWPDAWPCDPGGWMAGAGGKGMYPGGWDYPQDEGCGWPDKGGRGDGGGAWEADWYPPRGYASTPRRRPARKNGKSHMYVPKRLNLEERFRDCAGAGEVTTLMIRNVPNRYWRSLLMQELDELGFRGTYNFVYLPFDNATHWNVGYAFVNFDEPGDAKRCMQVMEGHEFTRFRQSRRRVAQVSTAHIQGLEQNLAHYKATALSSVGVVCLRPWIRKRPSAHADAAQRTDSPRCKTPQAFDSDVETTEEDLQRWEHDMIGTLLDEEDHAGGGRA